jgi:hypothetical protein
MRDAAIAIVAALVAAIAATLLLRQGPPAPATAPEPPQTARVSINSEPSGASVVVDGEDRGRTPVALSLVPGTHVVRLQQGSATREITVSAPAGSETSHYLELAAPVSPAGAPAVTRQSAATAVARPARPDAALTNVVAAGSRPQATSGTVTNGTINIATPFEVDVLEDGTPLPRDSSGNVTVPPGVHTLEFVNARLGVRQRRSVEVDGGRSVTVALDVPNGILHVNAVPWADVAVDGRPLGQTPLGNVSLPVGTHELVFTNPDLGTARRSVTVTADAPVRVSVDLRTQP